MTGGMGSHLLGAKPKPHQLRKLPAVRPTPAATAAAVGVHCAPALPVHVVTPIGVPAGLRNGGPAVGARAESAGPVLPRHAEHVVDGTLLRGTHPDTLVLLHVALSEERDALAPDSQHVRLQVDVALESLEHVEPELQNPRRFNTKHRGS